MRDLLADQFGKTVTDARELDATVARFLGVIQERAGLLIARGEGTFAFSHLTFQEYLAALAIAARDDYVQYTLHRAGDEWWREVILLEAGFLSTQSREKTTRLIRAIADRRNEPEPYHNLVLAAECVRDAGANRILCDLETELRGRLKREFDTPVSRGRLKTVHTFLTRGMSPAQAAHRRIAAAEALGKIGGNRFWTLPYGEPEWIEVAEGAFTMGEGEKAHEVRLERYSIARVPITCAQYALFVKATGHQPPPDWEGPRPPRGRETHPVVNVSFRDALSYCSWLSESTGKAITLPSEAEWEKAARGADDSRAFPWGDDFAASRCNVDASGFGMTTPVGIFIEGASPYGCLDMAGNVWEWTRSLGDKASYQYPYEPHDKDRESLSAGSDFLRVVRGGAWADIGDFARCADRGRYQPGSNYNWLGFRVVLRSAPIP